MAWRVAKSLEALLSQLNTAAPGRNKASDGSIGDAAHATTDSDHNPWVKDGAMGIVTARDFTHDPAHGADMNKFVAALVASRDPRIKYLIWNGRIVSSTISPWVWREYGGSNQHEHHAHLSVKSDKTHYDSIATWRIKQPDPPPKKVRFQLVDEGIVISESLLVNEGDNELERLQTFLGRVDGSILKRLQAEGGRGSVQVIRKELN